MQTDVDDRSLSDRVKVVQLDPKARFSLRCGEGEQAAIGGALGLELPRQPGGRATVADREIACLGPDEWLLLTSPEQAGELAAALAAVYPDAPHSLTEISDRELTFHIQGPEAQTLLSLGCPRDLEAFAEGRAVRTVFDGVSVVLWRDGQESFRLDVWRSFVPHVLGLLNTGQRELAAGL